MKPPGSDVAGAGLLILRPCPYCLVQPSGVAYPSSHLPVPGPAMIKVSITLPNNVQITLESDSEIVHEIVGTIL